MTLGLDISSKQKSRRTQNEFYRYYAGYPIEFAEWAIDKLGLDPQATLFDPWNGSGTTVAACAKKGFSAKGYDLNPVMVHLGRARIASKEDFSEARDFIKSVQTDFGKTAPSSLKQFCKAFRDLPITNEAAHSVLLTALYPRSPDLFGFTKTKNPTWFAEPKSGYRYRFEFQNFISEWLTLLDALQDWAVETSDEGAILTIERADSRKTYGRSQIFDGMLTSPPYLTRIDYVKATLPEFTLLQHLEGAPDARRLRRSMLGSPLTNSHRKLNLSDFPPRTKEVLSRINAHSSKASGTYYINFFASYFYDLIASIKRIHRALKEGATACFVVQASSYKEILVDLPTLLVEIAEGSGFSHIETVKFKVSRSMSLVNSKAHRSARRRGQI